MSNEMAVVTKRTQELVTDQECLKFDGKFNTNDLIDAAVFDNEEALIKEKEALSKEKISLRKQHAELCKTHTKLLENISKNSKNKDAENIVKSIEKFTGKKLNLVYNATISNKSELLLGITISKRRDFNDYYDAIVSNTIKSKLPEDISDSVKAKKECLAKITKIDSDMEDIQNEMNDLPRLKKRVKSYLVKNKIKSAKDGGEILKVLGQAIKDAAQD